MMRALVVLLLVANAAFFAWSQGWLDSVVGVRSIGDREPERLARQVRPETIRILPADAAASALAAPAALACLEAGPFGDAEVGAAEALIRAALPAGSWADVATPHAASWIVYMGKFANRDALTKKTEELARRKLAFDEIHANATLEPGLSLGRFETHAAATQALEQMTQQGVRSARVVELTPASTSHLLRIAKADAALAAQAAALQAEALGKGFAACAAAPGAR